MACELRETGERGRRRKKRGVAATSLVRGILAGFSPRGMPASLRSCFCQVDGFDVNIPSFQSLNVCTTRPCGASGFDSRGRRARCGSVNLACEGKGPKTTNQRKARLTAGQNGLRGPLGGAGPGGLSWRCARKRHPSQITSFWAKMRGHIAQSVETLAMRLETFRCLKLL